MPETEQCGAVTRGDRPRRNGAAWRYLALQVPGWALMTLLVVWLTTSAGVPPWLGAIVLAVFVGKDIVLYPVLRTTFDRPPRPARPIGARGVAVEPLQPMGFVRVNGELWTATARGDSIAAGRAVVVRDARGLTLLVEPAEEPPAAGRQ